MALFSRTFTRLVLCVFLYGYIISFYTFFTSSCLPQCGEFFSANGKKIYKTVFMEPAAKKSALLFNLLTELLNRHASAACATSLYCSG